MKILIIRYKKTQSVFEGGEMASNNNRRALCQIAGEENVETYYIHDESQSRSLMDYVKGLLYFPFGYYFGLTPRRVNEICRKARDFDIVFVDRSVFGLVAKRLKENGYKGRIVGFFHNVEVIYFSDKYSNNIVARKIVAGCADKNDRWTSQYCDRTIALNPRDDKELHRRYGRHADQLVPISLADKYADAKPIQELTSPTPVCLFLGSYFPANTEGIEWFIKNVKPYVNVHVRIVGKGMEKIMSESWITPDTEVFPNVPDLRTQFEEADFMVLPIFKGSGMKVKTCESLMYGKNIIATPEAWEGYEIDHSKAGCRCETPDDFIRYIKNVCENPVPKHNLYSRQSYLGKYSESSCIEKFRKVICE